MTFVVDQESEIFEKLLDPKFDWKELSDYGILTDLGTTASTMKKNSNRIHGKLAVILKKSDPNRQLKDFAKDINVSPSSLRGFKMVEIAFEGFDVPPDISWTVLAVLTKSQEDPQKCLQEALDHGLSNPEIIKSYGKNKNVAEKKIECPRCHALINVNGEIKKEVK